MLPSSARVMRRPDTLLWRTFSIGSLELFAMSAAVTVDLCSWGEPRGLQEAQADARTTIAAMGENARSEERSIRVRLEPLVRGEGSSGGLSGGSLNVRYGKHPCKTFFAPPYQEGLSDALEVSRLARPSVAVITCTVSVPLRSEMKTISRPSGDHDCAPSYPAVVVRRVRTRSATRTTSMSYSSPRVAWKAIREASGDQTGT